MSPLLRGLPLLALTLALAPVAASAAEVGGTVFDDRNGDGARGAGEPGLAGWVVYIDANANGLLDGDDTCTPQASEACVVTDATGAFVFRNLPAGDVRLRILAQLEGWRRTTEESLDVFLPTAESVVGDQRFGVFRLGMVTGTVFEDVDGNASRGDGEPPLGGWTAFVDADLDGALGPREPTGDSNAEGAYAIDGLTLGTHAVRLRNRCGFRLTVPPTPGRYVLSITASGQTIAGRDFGVQPPAVLPGDGNGDGVVTAADLTAVYLAIAGAGPIHGGDANQDGVVNFLDLPPTIANLFDCAGIAVAAVDGATPTPTATATNTPTPASPSATATAPPTASASATGAATATATSTNATPTATVAATASATSTASAPPTASATATLTRTPTVTSAPTPDTAALAGTAAQIANGMNAIPAVITALVSGIKFGAALTYDPDAQLSGIGGPAGACPLGGSATSACSAATTTVAFDSCRVPTASGSVTIDELPPTDPAVSLHGSLCVGKLALPPWTSTIGVSAVFRDAQNAQLLTATAALTGTINPSLGGSCQATGATLALTGTIRTQFADGSATSLAFSNTGVVVNVTNFNVQCVPVKYTMTFNGPATVTVSPPPALAPGAVAETSTPVVFTNFVVAQDATGSPTLTELDGGLGAACAGAALTLDTVEPLAQAVGAQCPTDGTLKVSAGGSTAQLFYRSGGAVDLDANNDGTPESQLASCREAPPLCSGGNPTPTATRTPSPAATRTVTPAATATSTVTPLVAPTASATATITATIAADATPTSSATRTLTPTPTATAAAEPEEYCDTLPGPALIPDNNATGVNNTIVVQSARTIADLNLSLNVAHTWVGDLRATLTHVDTGKTITLLDRPGVPAGANGCGLDDIDAVFDDAALRLVENRCAAGPPLAAAIDGSVKPDAALGAFNGESLNGSWRLNIADLAPADTGSLLGWCLRPNSLAPVVTQFTCGQGDTECVQVVDVPFSLSFSYGDPDGDAESWHIVAHISGGSDFDAGSGSLASGSGGTVSLDFSPFTCPSLNCPDADVDYTITIQDQAGHQSPPMRLRLIVTLFEL